MLRSGAVFAGYQHFLRLAARVQWDEAEIDLRADAQGLAGGRRRRG